MRSVVIGVLALGFLFASGAVAQETAPTVPPQDVASVQLVEVGGYASCFIYELQDVTGNPVALPPAVAAALDCPASVSLSPDGGILAFSREDRFEAYDLERGRIIHLLVLPDDLDGISGAAWSPEGRQLAVVLVGQLRYEATTRLIAMRLEAGELVGKRRFDVRVRYVCGAICASVPGSDFWFETETLLGYRTWFEDPYEDERPDSLRTLELE